MPPRPHHVKVTRYLLRGRRVPKGTPGARAVTQETAAYYAKIGRRRVPLHTADLATAEAELRRLLREGPDPARAHHQRPLAEHFAAYLAHLEAKGTTARHRGQVKACLDWLARAAGWAKLADLSSEGLEGALAKLEALGRGAQTRKMYRSAARAFGAWCVRRGRLARDPFPDVPTPNAQADRRLVHREPTPEELQQLFAYLAGPRCPSRRGMTGPERATGYRVCLGTGFRADELRSLGPWSFAADYASVQLPARDDKRRRAVVQPLPAWLAAELRAHFAAGRGTWERFPAHDPGQVLSEDLAASGVALVLPTPEAPGHFTFHSLRVRFIGELCADPANDVKTIMELARHSDPKLTLRMYAKYRQDSGRAALERLPPP